jgi:hypothetical protein
MSNLFVSATGAKGVSVRARLLLLLHASLPGTGRDKVPIVPFVLGKAVSQRVEAMSIHFRHRRRPARFRHAGPLIERRLRGSRRRDGRCRREAEETRCAICQDETDDADIGKPPSTQSTVLMPTGLDECVS